jgi:hypothetical protein
MDFFARQLLRAFGESSSRFQAGFPCAGEGSVAGVLLGIIALLQVLQSLVSLLRISSSLYFAVMVTVILLGF